MDPMGGSQVPPPTHTLWGGAQEPYGPMGAQMGVRNPPPPAHPTAAHRRKLSFWGGVSGALWIQWGGSQVLPHPPYGGGSLEPYRSNGGTDGGPNPPHPTAAHRSKLSFWGGGSQEPYGSNGGGPKSPPPTLWGGVSGALQVQWGHRWGSQTPTPPPAHPPAAHRRKVSFWGGGLSGALWIQWGGVPSPHPLPTHTLWGGGVSGAL